MKALSLTAFLFVALGIVGQSAVARDRQTSNAFDIYMKPQTLVRLPDGRRFNLFCIGQGEPTAILEASASRWNISWRNIQPEFAKATRVCAADRAGFGFSDPGPAPRDVNAEEADLHDALVAADIKPPYIMVGHSYGGRLVRLFAYRHPDEVAGILLIDPGIEHQYKLMGISADELARDREHTVKCIEIARAGKIVMGETPPGLDEPCELRPGDDWSSAMYANLMARAAKPQYYEANAAEEATYEAPSSDEIDAARRPLGDIPLVVLSEDEAHFTEDLLPEQDGRKRYAAWVAGHEDMAKDSTQGYHEIVPGAGHWIFNDNKDLVLAKFRQIVEAVKHRLAAHMTSHQP